jgi:putative aldouronate transport system permease protein
MSKRAEVVENTNIIKKTAGDRTFDFINYTILVLILFIILYPLWLIVISSVSDAREVLAGHVFLYPIGLTFDSYTEILGYRTLWTGYRNTLFYTLAGTTISVISTMMAAYASSRKFLGKGLVNFYFVFTMFFNGGLIPTFLTMRDLGLYDNIWIMIIAGAISVWNLMIARTYVTNSIPGEMYEASMIDGANHFQVFFRIVLPLSKTIIAVLIVYYGVQRWNDYFTGLIYLRNRMLLPLQTYLKEILASLQSTSNLIDQMDSYTIQDSVEALQRAEAAKYSIIVISTVPMIVLYIIMQKYFVEGVMIGSLKG